MKYVLLFVFIVMLFYILLNANKPSPAAIERKKEPWRDPGFIMDPVIKSLGLRPARVIDNPPPPGPAPLKGVLRGAGSPKRSSHNKVKFSNDVREKIYSKKTGKVKPEQQRAINDRTAKRLGQRGI